MSKADSEKPLLKTTYDHSLSFFNYLKATKSQSPYEDPLRTKGVWGL